jgi:hypothetical protein
MTFRMYFESAFLMWTFCRPQVIQAKKRLLDNLHAEVASSEDGKLKRMLIEDETTLKRREQCTHRLKLLKKAAEELSAASY